MSLYTMGGLRAFRKPLPYNMYLFNLRIANHILIKINKDKDIYIPLETTVNIFKERNTECASFNNNHMEK